MCTVGISLHIYLNDMISRYFTAHLYYRCIHWASAHTSVLKLCMLHISLHIYPKDVFASYLPAHLFSRCVHRASIRTYTESCAHYVYPYTSNLKMCQLHKYPSHLYWKWVCWASAHTSILKMSSRLYSITSIWQTSLLGISLHICIKDVYTGHLPTYLILNICTLSISLHIYLNDMPSPISLHTYIKDLDTGHMPTHLS